MLIFTVRQNKSFRKIIPSCGTAEKPASLERTPEYVKKHRLSG